MSSSSKQTTLGLSTPSEQPEDIETLVANLQRYNTAYRSGVPLISDMAYDTLVEQLRALDPEHAFLHQVEPEAAVAADEQVRHARPMLSTEKAYTREQLERFVERVLTAAAEIGAEDVRFRVTPKLDGLAGNDEGGILATRGNGRVGANITNAFQKGVVPIGGRGLGLGEIVIQQSYFEEHFTGIFEHPRNMAVGIIKADNVNAQSQKALDDGKVHFVPYANLPAWEGSGTDLVNNIGEITEQIRQQVDYALDGMVAQSTHQQLNDHMGATSHHHRWQIAIKERGETAQATIETVLWQTGRVGKITPVLCIEPVRLSGANISRITAHHAGMVRDRQLGTGAVIEIIRSGEVIPKLEKVITPATQDNVNLPTNCPSCGESLTWSNDFLFCMNNTSCPAQAVGTIRHWFKTLGTVDWFGEKTITRLVDGGFDTLEKVYALTEANLIKLGFGPGQTHNLLEALSESTKIAVEDARFLAAFGIRDLGIGDSRNLLRHFKLETLGTLKAEQLVAIKGFGDVTSESITSGLQRRWPTISHMLNKRFTLEATPLEAERAKIASPIAGKTVLFTGKMVQGTRDEMKKQAMALGATVLSGISSKLNILIIGERASAGKVSKATAAGAQVMTEAEYLTLLNGK